MSDSTVTNDPSTDDRPGDDVLVPTTALRRLRFDNRFTRELPADPRTGAQLRQVTGAAFSRVRPVRVPAPRIVSWSKEISDELGLDDEVWSTEEAADVFTGNRVLAGSDPHAANYGGHQFGNWAGQLGVGRAIGLGEVVDRDGRLQMLQLKGAGPTPYSRRADGLAVVRSSIREFLCSEAMAHLGVPTTRALSLATTGTDVVRDMFYDGNPRPEPGAVVCRVAPSFLRFGSYQLFASRGEIDELRILADYTIRHHFAHLGDPSPETYAAWFDEVCNLSCDMVVDWMRVGFVHGVMNTDNMSIHGLTIDYGPYGWIDDFDPDWTPNTTDAAGRRYRFGYQPQVTQWNLLQLANALYPLTDDPDPLQASLNGFVERYRTGYRTMMLAKLGLPGRDDEADDALIAELVEVLRLAEIDMTIFFRSLGTLLDAPLAVDPAFDPLDPARLGAAFYDLDELGADQRARLEAWLGRWGERGVGLDAAARRRDMDAINPKYVLRNYLAQQAIDEAERGDFSEVERLLELLRRPYDEQPASERYAARRPDWARDRPGCSMLSCSS